jgi:hypothetical protein
MAALRISELNRLYKARHGDPLPNTEHTRKLIDIIAQHMLGIEDSPLHRLAFWAGEHAPWMTAGEIGLILQQALAHHRTWKADSLAWHLKLTYQDRQALKIKTIGAINCNAKQRAALRRKDQNKRRKASRNRLKSKAYSAPTA